MAGKDKKREESLPGATETTGLVPHFLDQRIVLDDDGVLNESSGRRGTSETSDSLVGWWGHSARIEVDIEGGAQLSRSRTDVDAVGITVVTLAEDHAIEWPVELNIDPHVGLLALDLKVLDLRLISCWAYGPSVFSHRSDRSWRRRWWWVIATQAGRWWW